MLNLRKWLFDDPTADWKEVTIDPALGELRLSEDGDWWESTTRVGDRTIRFLIGGEDEPDAGLLAHAHDIIAQFDSFERTIKEFLEKEASKPQFWGDNARYYGDEIRQLKIDSVSLFRPERPNEGMIYFHGPDEYRVWRCDYVDRKPTGLGFDD